MKHCPICNAQYENGKFCLDCGELLVEDAPASEAGISLNLGDANAISGGIHMNDSHNVSNVDQRVINTSTVSNVTNNITQLERQKTETEILQERKIQFMEVCKQVYADGILEEHEKALLEMKRIELNLDQSTAAQLIETARRSMNSRMTALTVKDSVTMKLINKLVLENKAEQVKAQIPRLEAMARMYQVDEVLFNYNMLLAALNPDKLIQQYESQPTDEYWQTFWVCLAYLKKSDMEKFEEASLRLNLYPNYSENNDLILQTISISHDFGADSDTVKEVMSILDESMCSPELKTVIHALYLVADPEKAKEVGADRKSCAFLMENIISLESPEARAERLAKEKAEAEAKARAEAEAAARAKAEQEAVLRKQITYSVIINRVDNQMLAMMTARGVLGWSSADSRTNLAQLPFLAKQTDNQAEAKALAEKLAKGGMTVSFEAVNGMGEKVDNTEYSKSNKDVAATPVEESATFDVILKSTGAQKLAVVHLVKELTGLGLKETKELVDAAPKVIKEGMDKETADHWRAELEEVGATVQVQIHGQAAKHGYINIRKGDHYIHATDDTIFQIVRDEIEKFGRDADLNHIDVSRCTTFFKVEKRGNEGGEDEGIGLFEGTGFCGDVSKWDVSNVENMRYLFRDCREFNCNISDWKVGKVTDMQAMFQYCENFNCYIGDWDVSKVTNMSMMFLGCK